MTSRRRDPTSTRSASQRTHQPACESTSGGLGSERSSTRRGGCVELLRRGKGSPDDVPRHQSPPRQREIEHVWRLRRVVEKGRRRVVEKGKGQS